jgi:hypothetical protein
MCRAAEICPLRLDAAEVRPFQMSVVDLAQTRCCWIALDHEGKRRQDGPDGSRAWR